MGLLAIAEQRLKQMKEKKRAELVHNLMKPVAYAKQAVQAMQSASKIEKPSPVLQKPIQNRIPKPDPIIAAKQSEQKPIQKQVSKPKPKPVPKLPATKQITTVFDNIVSIVENDEELEFKDAAARFNVSTDKIEEWAKILEEHGLVKIYYPAFGSPRMRKP